MKMQNFQANSSSVCPHGGARQEEGSMALGKALCVGGTHVHLEERMAKEEGWGYRSIMCA